MDIKLRYPLYNADGSSFSDTRCEQICDVFDMTQKYHNTTITYRGLQELATKNEIFGKSGFDQTASAIRTIFPLLKKLGLIVDYDEVKDFKASDFFSPKGKAFVLTHKALMQAQVIDNKPLVRECEEAKSAILRDGIKYMFERGDYLDHNIWLALTFFKFQGEIIWKEFLYIVFLYDSGLGINEIANKLQENRSKSVEYRYITLEGREIKSTSYSYLKALLIEAGIVRDSQKGISNTTTKGYEFLNQIQL